MKNMNRKQKLIQLIHVAKGKVRFCTCGTWVFSQPCNKCGLEASIKMDDDAYRAFIEGITGKDSTKEMNVPELESVVEAFRRKGFISKFSLPHYMSKEKERMILSIEHRGKENLGFDWEKRIKGFIKKTFHKDSLQFCNVNELRTVQGFITRIQKGQQPQYK